MPFEWEHRADERERGFLPLRIARGFAVYFQQHVVELSLSSLGLGSPSPQGRIDPVGGTIGSLDRIYVLPGRPGEVILIVYNEMGAASATRIPGTEESLREDRDRGEAGPGGTILQLFYWSEAAP